MNLFSGLSQTQKQMVFEGLMLLLKSESTLGFKNDKLGMAYVIGAKNGESDYDQHGDSADCNQLYQMLVELSEDLRGHSEIPKFVNCWQDFCRIAVDAHRKNKASD